MAFLERNLEQLTVVQRQLVEQNSQLKKEAAIAERKLATRTERIKNLESLLHDSQEKLTAASHRFVNLFPSPTSPTSPTTSLSSKQLRQRKHSGNLRELYDNKNQVAACPMYQQEQKWPYRPDTFEEQSEEGFWTRIPTPPQARDFSPPFNHDSSNFHISASASTSSPRSIWANHTISRFEVQLQSVKDRLEAAKAGSTRGLSIGAPGSGHLNFGDGPRIAKPLRGGGGGDAIVHPSVQSLQANEGGNKRASWFFNQRA
jgi:hypothetical protein